MAKKTKKPSHAPAAQTVIGRDETGALVVGQPQFSQPTTSADPTKFSSQNNDTAFYKKVNTKLLQPIPPPRDGASITMTLADVLGNGGAAAVAAIEKSGQIVFHSVGDTGSTKGPETQNQVSDKLVLDFSDPDAADRPAFCFHLGDVVYSFGEASHYYDQFYEPYRSYPKPIFAVPGNHDGLVYTGEGVTSLDAFKRNFANAAPVKTPESGGLIRTAMTQPGVYFTLDAPFVTIIGLYSNVLEDPGVISSQGDKNSPVDDQQLPFLLSALQFAKKKGGATILVTHHPPYSGGSIHSGSPKMLADIDAQCTKAAFWPHAHLSGHAHNYQRFTRTVNKFDIPYIVCGNGGHNPLAKIKGSPRAPINVSSDVILESYDDSNFGYLRIVADAKQLRIEFHPAPAGATSKSATDVVTVDLASHTMVSN